MKLALNLVSVVVFYSLAKATLQLDEDFNEEAIQFLEENLWKARSVYNLDDCPLNCSCLDVFSTKRIFLACKKGLNNLPGYRPSRTRYLSYTHSSLPLNTLTNSGLVQFSQVKILKLSNNNIRIIEPQAFKPILNLLLLFLDNNPFVASPSVSFVPFLNPQLRLLSLKNVLARETPDQCVWDFLRSSEQRQGEQSNTHFALKQLEELRLDQNRLTSIDTQAFVRTINIFKLKRLGLAENRLTENDLLDLLQVFRQVLKSQKAFQLMGDTNKTGKDAELRLNSKSVGNLEVILNIDFSANQIDAINSTTLSFVQTLLNSSFKFFHTDQAYVSKTVNLLLNLKNNPWICSCKIIPLQILISSETKRSFIKDWKSMRCSYPRSLAGVSLLNVINSPNHKSACKGIPERSVTQLIFIVLTSIVLSLVTLIVAILNRSKFIFCFSFMKNCGEDDESTTTARWKSDPDKYTSPKGQAENISKQYRPIELYTSEERSIENQERLAPN